MNFFISIFLILSLLLLVASLGFATLKISKLEKYYDLSLTLGFSIVAILCNILYFAINLNTGWILVFLSLVFIFCLFFNFYFDSRGSYKVFKNIFFLSLPISCFFLGIAQVYGEQFYVFRGNYYDHFNYVANGLAMSIYKFSDINTFYQDMRRDFPYHSLNLGTRPISALLMSLLYKLKHLDIFYLSYLFKVIQLIITSTAVLFFFKTVSTSKNSLIFLFVSFVFVFSFWAIWIFEIDSLPQLSSLAVYICAFALLLDLDKHLKAFNYKFLTIYAIIISSLFILYPEISTMYFVIAIIFALILKWSAFNFFYETKKQIFFVIFLFLLFTLANFQGTYIYLISDAIKNGIIGLNDFWGYYGAFILGRENAVLQIDAARELKSFYLLNPKINELIFQVISINFDNDYFLFPANIIPSLFGFYFVTVSKGISAVELAHASLLVLFSVYLIYQTYKNFKSLFASNNVIAALLNAFLIFLLIFSILLIFTGAYWSLVKFYFYMSPFIFLFICFKFKQHEKSLFMIPNYFVMILMLYFPIYKYGVFNSGIGRLDSFPSIIDKKEKQNFSWKFKKENLHNCANIYINVDEKFKLKYISLLLAYNKYNFFTSKIVIDDEKKKLFIKDSNCTITISDGNFNIDKI